jgi:hypothetical protein
MKYCQGPKCHTYETQDRLRGPKGAKTYQTRRRTSLLFGAFCDNRCWTDWTDKYIERALNHFGRIVEPIKLTEENAWTKDYDYDWQAGTTNNYRFVNKITQQQIPITEQQYNNPDLVRPL